MNAIVLPPGYETGSHFHDEQEELYFVHWRARRDRVRRRLRPGAGAGRHGLGRRPPRASSRNLGDTEEAVYVIVGGKGGYVGRDGRLAEGETHR